MLKLTISEFFKRLISNIWRRSHEITLITIRWFLLITFIAVVVADLAECAPIHKAWQVVPDPGARCRQGYAQLLTMGIADVVTDFLLVFFPISIIIGSTMKTKRKFQLIGLFAGSLLPAGTTMYRLPKIIDRNGSQQYRSLLASVEILFATAVANALVLGSFVRDKGIKKQRWKFGSLSDSIERTTSRRPTIAARHWGSDEDLVRDLGISLDPELRGKEIFTPRPAPMAVPALLNGRNVLSAKARQMMGPMDTAKEWQFPHKSSGSECNTTDEDIDLIKLQPADFDRSPGDIASINSPRKVSFFDVGGLLDEDVRGEDRRVSSIATMDSGESSIPGVLSLQPDFHGNNNTTTSNFWSENGGLSPPPPRRGSAVLLQDIGGLLGSPVPTSNDGPRYPRKQSRNQSQIREEKRGYELKDFLREDHPPPPRNNGARSSSPMSKAKMRSAFDDLEPPVKAAPTSHPNLAAQRRQRDFAVAPRDEREDAKRSNDLQKHLSLQDVGGLLKS